MPILHLPVVLGDNEANEFVGTRFARQSRVWRLNSVIEVVSAACPSASAKNISILTDFLDRATTSVSGWTKETDIEGQAVEEEVAKSTG